MQINKTERIVIDNWFSSNKEIGSLINKNSKNVSSLKARLRKRFQPEQRKYLTEDQISVILSTHGNKTAKEVAENVNVTQQCVYNIWAVHNRKKSDNPKDYMFKYSRIAWSLDETLFIEQNYKKPFKVLSESKIIQNRSKDSINLKKWYIQKNGGIFYDIEKVYNAKGERPYDEYIKRAGNTLTAKELSTVLGVSDGTVRVTAKRLNVNLKTSLNNWREDEINLLKEMYPTHTAAEVAKMINRSMEATKTKVRNLGIQKYKINKNK